MATTTDATVNAFYLAYYGRPADPAGLAYWSAALAQSDGDFSSIISAFSTSAEATAHFSSASTTDYIGAVYQQLFGRAADTAGLAYWTSAIENGSMSLADAAIQIMNGAQSTDAQVSTLRQEAAAQFTAAVAASGVDYDGSAAVEAARVLISAVTTTSSAADITALVAASASLVQTVHDNPAILTALAGSGDLSSLLSTSSGKADPVALVQALASIGKAALTDSAGLTLLLHGDGVAGLLAALPSGTTLTDVATAVATGGLAAGAAVADPAPVATTPADTTAPAAPTVHLQADTGFDTSDGITGNGKVVVSGLEAGSTWQYSNDAGKTWTTGPAAKGGTAILQTSGFGEHTLLVRSTDAAGNVGATTTLKYDLEATIAFLGSDGNDLSTATLHTNSNDYTLALHGASLAASVQLEVSATGTDGWTAAQDTPSEGSYYVRYVLTDSAGKTSTSNVLAVVADTTQAAAATIKLVTDSGTLADDNYTNDGHVAIGITDANASWTYSTDNGNTWTIGSGTALTLATPTDGAHSVLVRTYDTADGVTSYTVAALDYTVDTVAPALGLALQSVEGAPAGTTLTNLAYADAVFDYTGTLDIDNGDAFFYSINGGAWIRADAAMIDTVNKTVTIGDIDLRTSDATIAIETKDAAGNTVDLTQTIASTYTKFSGSTSADGIILTSTKDGNAYLTDGTTVHEIQAGLTANGTVTIGVQQTLAEGILGVGPSAAVHTNGNSTVYSLGTDGADVQKGQFVWGYDGDDTIVALGGGYINGGNGADTVDATAGSSKFGFASAQESTIVADDSTAHGFDTITVNTTSDAAGITHTQTFSFTTPSAIDGFFGPLDGNATLTGSETGNALLALINTAVHADLKTDGTVEAAFIAFHVQDAADVNFLVVDANGDGTIDGADYVVKIVGTIDVAHSTLDSAGVLTLATA